MFKAFPSELMAAAGAAGQEEAAVRHGEAEFPRFGFPAEAGPEHALRHIAQHGGREPGGIPVV